MRFDSTIKNSDMKILDAVKTTFLLFTFCCLSFFAVIAQDEAKVWATILNSSDVPFLNNRGDLISNDASFNSMISELGITKVFKAVPSSKTPSLSNVYEIASSSVNPSELLAALTNKVAALSGIVYAPIYNTLETPNDHQGIAVDYAINLINAESAWDYSIGSSSVVIAISDQNIDTNHSELLGKVVHFDGSNETSSTHGTAVSIVAAGNTDNDIISSHIGFNSSIAFYQMNYDEVLLASYAGHKVINLSWTSGCDFNPYVQVIIEEVYDNGTFIVAASGNGSTCGGPDNLVYPAAYEHVFSVTSIGAQDNHERIIGNASSTHQHNEMVDLSAPGYYVSISPAQGWTVLGTGTSYATPYVTGTVGLMLAANPCLTNENIEYILKNSSAFIDDINPDYAGLIGAGRLDAGAALAMSVNFNEMQLSALVSFSCEEASVQLDMNINGGVAPYTAAWSNGYSGLSLSSLQSGAYSVTVTDAMGCSTDSTFTVEAITPLELVGAVQDFSCGDVGMQLEMGVLGGVAPYAASWSNGATDFSLSNLQSGEYTVTVSDAMGCLKDSTFTIDDVTALVFESAIQHVTCNGVSNGAIDLTILDGTPNYSYLWSNDMTTEDIFDLAPGTYRVKITDGNGCESLASYEVVQPADVETHLEVVEPLIYAPVSDLDLTVEGGIAPYSYTWNTGDFSEDLYGVSSGFYEVTVMDANGCIKEASTTIENLNTSGISEVESMQVGVYPNPTADYAQISWDNDAINTIAILNSNGQIVQEVDVAMKNTYTTKALTSGIYFINLSENNSYVATKKLVVR